MKALLVISLLCLLQASYSTLGISGDGGVTIYGNKVVLSNTSNVVVGNINLGSRMSETFSNTLFVPSLFSSNMDAQAFQTVATDNIFDVEHFQIGTDHFIAVGGFWSSCKILKWNSTTLKFDDFQSFPELSSASPNNWITDWEYFTIGNRSFLAFSRYNFNVNNAILEWNINSQRFVYFQNFTINSISYGWKFWDTGVEQFLFWSQYTLGSTRIYRWNGSSFISLTALTTGVFPVSYAPFFNFLDGRYYIAIANEKSASNFVIPNGVQIYVYQGNGQIVLFQNITAKGAKSVRSFAVRGLYQFLAVAEATNDATQYDIDSSIYSWDGNLGRFTLFQSIPTSSASAWQYYKMDTEDYLVVANFNSLVNSQGYGVKSKLYRFSGTLFAEVGEISTTGASCLSFFSIDYHYFLFIGYKSNGLTFQLNSVLYQVNP